jgi:outer membrane immunogenic protein
MHRERRFLTACAVFYWGSRMRLIITALLGATALSLACAPGALAADMPVKAPYAVGAYNWTGFYAGVNAGYGWGNTNTDISFLPSAVAFGEAPFTINSSPSGFIGGIQAGYNYQFGKWVLGIEADISGASITGSGGNNALLRFPSGAINPGAFSTVSQKMDWFGTVRPRLGVTPIDRVLVYATGGLAYGHVSYSTLTQFPATPPIQYQGTDSTTRVGWTVGGGLEWALMGNWSVKAEYLYYNLGTDTIIAPSQFPALTALGFVVQNTFETKGSIARAGLNYKF